MPSPTCTIWLESLWEPCSCQWHLWSPIPYMECRNLVTVSDMVPHTLYGMQEPCNCQWLMVPYTLYRMWDLVTVNHLWSPHTLYGMWEPCKCQWLLLSPLILYGTGIIWSPHMYDMIFSRQLQKRSTAHPNEKVTCICCWGYTQHFLFKNVFLNLQCLYII